MNRAAHFTAEQQRRGHWLRCFLGGALWLVAAGIFGGFAPLDAMTCVSGPRVHLARIHGQVFDSVGVPMPQVALTVAKDGRQIAVVRSDDTGAFDIRVPSGDYEVHGESPGFQSLNIHVRVESGLPSLVRRGSLKLILGFGGTSCGFATTSNKQFRNEINHDKQRLKESS